MVGAVVVVEDEVDFTFVEVELKTRDTAFQFCLGAVLNAELRQRDNMMLSKFGG